MITYGLAWLMWNGYPERVETFVTSQVGSMFVGLSVLLQCVGLLWIAGLSRVEV